MLKTPLLQSLRGAKRRGNLMRMLPFVRNDIRFNVNLFKAFTIVPATPDWEIKPLKLFQPLRIGSLEVKNRLVMAPMATHYAYETGAVTQKLRDYYLARSRGGVG